MLELAPSYLSALAEQFGFFASFVGRFSATIFVTLLTLTQKSRPASYAIALAAIAAVLFIVTVSISMTLLAATHPDAPAQVANVPTDGKRIFVGLTFILGLYSLLGAIAASGWIRSRRLGWTITEAALLGAICVTAQFAVAG